MPAISIAIYPNFISRDEGASLTKIISARILEGESRILIFFYLLLSGFCAREEHLLAIPEDLSQKSLYVSLNRSLVELEERLIREVHFNKTIQRPRGFNREDNGSILCRISSRLRNT